MKNCTPHTIVIVPNGVQVGHAERFVHIEPSGEVLQLVMEEPLVFKNPVQVGENAGVTVSFDKIDALRSNAAIVTVLDSTDGPILVSDAVVDYVRSDWVAQSEMKKRIFAPDKGPTALRDEQGQIVAVTRLRSAYEPWPFDNLVDRRKPGKQKGKPEVGSAGVQNDARDS